MATSGIPSGGSLPPLAPTSRPVVSPPASVTSAAATSSFYGAPDPVVTTGLWSRPDSSRRPTTLQARPEYALVMLMAQRPGQLRKLFESLGHSGTPLDVEAAVADLQTHLAGGGTLAQFGAKRDLDATTLYLLAVQSRIAMRSGKGKTASGFERDMDDLLADHEAEIAAALNTSRAMRTLAGSASDRMWMRSLYVAAITVRSPINETFESLLQRFGTEGFEQGAATLLRALSDDIASHRSSVAPDRLQGLLLASLVSMRHVVGLIHSSQGFLRGQGLVAVRPARAADDQPSDNTEKKEGGGGQRNGTDEQQRKVETLTVQLVRLLLSLTATSNAAKAVPVFLNQEVGSGLPQQELLRLRSQFIELIRSLPPSLWKEATHKDHLIEALRRQFEAEMTQRALPAIGAGSQPNGARP